MRLPIKLMRLELGPDVVQSQMGQQQGNHTMYIMGHLHAVSKLHVMHQSRFLSARFLLDTLLLYLNFGPFTALQQHSSRLFCGWAIHI